ncbi:formate--tetrahydrofolate ligase, partial [Mycolicibacterium canariasense]
MGITQAEIDRRFDLHTPTDANVHRTLDVVRRDFKQLVGMVVAVSEHAPREQAIAVHHLEDALAATIGAIVRPSVERPGIGVPVPGTLGVSAGLPGIAEQLGQHLASLA